LQIARRLQGGCSSTVYTLGGGNLELDEKLAAPLVSPLKDSPSLVSLVVVFDTTSLSAWPPSIAPVLLAGVNTVQPSLSNSPIAPACYPPRTHDGCFMEYVNETYRVSVRRGLDGRNDSCRNGVDKNLKKIQAKCKRNTSFPQLLFLVVCRRTH
jgi:hypothetical protein